MRLFVKELEVECHGGGRRTWDSGRPGEQNNPGNGAKWCKVVQKRRSAESQPGLQEATETTERPTEGKSRNEFVLRKTKAMGAVSRSFAGSSS